MKINSYSFSLKKYIKVYFPLSNLIKKLEMHKFIREIEVDQKDYLQNKTLFAHVEIETINRCNNDCPFCPVNKHDDIREFKKMDDGLFKKIIDELKDLSYAGDISLYSNNEPLLDGRIYDFIKYSKQNIPKAKHILYTNGIMLTVERYEKLFESGLDFLLIDNYDDSGKLIPSVQTLVDFYKDEVNPYELKTEIVLRKKDEVLSNRAGMAPNGKKTNILNISCYLPFKQLIIRPDGKVSMCCYDSYGKSEMGDLNIQSIKDVWYGKKHMGLLEHLYKKGRKEIPLCEKCDTAASKERVWGGIA